MKNFLLILFFISSLGFANNYQILGLGTPCIDYIISVKEEDLLDLQLAKGGQREIEPAEFKNFFTKYSEVHIFTGDCAANTIKGLAALGMTCALTGKIGYDTLGRHVRAVFNDLRVTTLFTDTNSPPDQIACLVTPDGERSFCKNSIHDNQMVEKDLIPELFKGVKLVHLEGYSLTNGFFMEKAMQMAKESEAMISLDLASAEIVSKYRERILAFLEKYVDILFVNAEEAFALTKLPPHKSARFLNILCPYVVVKVGDQGCWVCSKEGLFHSPGIPTKVVDTTGAGDIFASAFLYAYLNGNALNVCAEFGNRAGSAAVEKYGAELSLTRWEKLKQNLLSRSIKQSIK